MCFILFWVDPHIVAWVMNDIIPESEKWSKLFTLGVWFVLLWVSLIISFYISLLIGVIFASILDIYFEHLKKKRKS